MRRLLLALAFLIVPLSAHAQGVSSCIGTDCAGVNRSVVYPGAQVDYSRQDCTSSNPTVANTSATSPTFPVTPCNNPNGMIAIDPTRSGLAVNLGGRPDANGSMYAIDITGANTCAAINSQCTANVTPYTCCTGSGTGTCSGTGTGVALGCVDAADDFISFEGLTVANSSIPIIGANSRASQTLTYGGGNSYDTMLCRSSSAPYDVCNSSTGTCSVAIPANQIETYILKHNDQASCVGADNPVDGCTGSGAGTWWRYYPTFVSTTNACSGAGDTLTTYNGNPVATATGDSLQVYTMDGTHVSAYGHAWLAQTIEEATYEEHFIPRVNLMPGGNLETATGDATTANCIIADSTNSWTFVKRTAGASNWIAVAAKLDPSNQVQNRLAVYGKGCYAIYSDGSNAGSYARSSLVPVSAGTSYTLNGMVMVSISASPGAQIAIEDQAGTIIDPGASQTVWNAWSPRGGANKDPLTYGATAFSTAAGGTAAGFTMDAYATRGWQQVVIKINVPSGVTGIRVLVGRGANSSNIGIDEWYAYPSLFQNLRLNRIFPDGLNSWTMTGDSRQISDTYAIASGYPATFGALDYAHTNGFSNRPLMWFSPSSLYPTSIDALGGRKVTDVLAQARPFSLVSSRRPRFAMTMLGLNDINGSATPAATETAVMKAREKIASYGAIPVWILETPWKGAVGTAGGAQVCSVTTAAPDNASVANNCGSAILSLNRRILHDGVAW